MASFASLTNQELSPSAGVDSYNIMPVLLGDRFESPIREATVVRSGGGCLAILKQGWKMASCPGSGSSWAGTPTTGQAREQGLPSVQLYNLRTDIDESENLEGTRGEKVSELQNLLNEYIKNGRSTAGPPRQNWKGKNTWKELEQ
jgi:hypothetical protein